MGSIPSIGKINQGGREPNEIIIMVGYQTSYQNLYKFFHMNCRIFIWRADELRKICKDSDSSQTIMNCNGKTFREHHWVNMVDIRVERINTNFKPFYCHMDTICHPCKSPISRFNLNASSSWWRTWTLRGVCSFWNWTPLNLVLSYFSKLSHPGDLVTNQPRFWWRI